MPGEGWLLQKLGKLLQHIENCHWFWSGGGYYSLFVSIMYVKTFRSMFGDIRTGLHSRGQLYHPTRWLTEQATFTIVSIYHNSEIRCPFLLNIQAHCLAILLKGPSTRNVWWRYEASSHVFNVSRDVSSLPLKTLNTYNTAKKSKRRAFGASRHSKKPAWHGETVKKAHIWRSETIEKARIRHVETIKKARIWHVETIKKAHICPGKTIKKAPIWRGETIKKARIWRGKTIKKAHICCGETIKKARIWRGKTIKKAHICCGETIKKARIWRGKTIKKARPLGHGAAGTERRVTARGELGSLLGCQARSAEELGGVGAHCSGTCPPWDISSRGRNIPKKRKGTFHTGPLRHGIVFLSQICMKAKIDQSILLLLLLRGK